MQINLNRDYCVFDIETDGLLDNTIGPIYEDSKGTLWIGTWDSGINLIKDGVLSYLTTEHGLSSNLIRTIYEDNKNNIWIGTYGSGLNLYKNNSIKAFSKKKWIVR